MGNILSSKKPGILSRNKDFQSVVPFPNSSSTEDPMKKRKLEAISPNISTISKESPVDDKIIKNDSQNIPSVKNSDDKESQIRLKGMANYEKDCTEIFKYLFIGGKLVAENYKLLQQENITRIVNCSLGVTPNYHSMKNEMRYLSLNLLDGKEEDISWFVCQVINFIMEGKRLNEKTLVHCQCGISRSCSLVIAFRMWITGERWKESFDFVQSRRKICSPNTAFTCNLIELDDIFHGSSRDKNLVFRCAYHGNHDSDVPVLKLCRDPLTRKILEPSKNLFDSKGIFVLRGIKDNNHYMFIWCGCETQTSTQKRAEQLAYQMKNIFTKADTFIVLKEGEETELFRSFLNDNESKTIVFNDFYDFPPKVKLTIENININKSTRNMNQIEENLQLPTCTTSDTNSISSPLSRSPSAKQDLISGSEYTSDNNSMYRISSKTRIHPLPDLNISRPSSSEKQHSSRFFSPSKITPISFNKPETQPIIPGKITTTTFIYLLFFN